VKSKIRYHAKSPFRRDFKWLVGTMQVRFKECLKYNTWYRIPPKTGKIWWLLKWSS